MKFHNAKIIQTNTDPDIYHRKDPNVRRGDMDFIMSKSELENFYTCPSRWKLGYREMDEERTKSLEWGSLIDTLLLSPDRFDDKYAVTPLTYQNDKGEEKGWNWNATVCKEWRDQQIGKETIKPDKMTDAEAAIKRLRDDTQIAEILETSQKQVMIIGEYHDDATGLIIPVKALLDMLMPSGAIVDLKTCQSAHPLAWPKQVYNYNYHMQAAFYKDLYDSATGNQREELFAFILSENYSPWEIGKRLLSVEFEEMGRDKYESALKIYCQCLATKTWPGYDDNAEYNGWSMTEPEVWMIK